MLGQRRRRWPNITPALVQRLVFAGISLYINVSCAVHTINPYSAKCDYSRFNYFDLPL